MRTTSRKLYLIAKSGHRQFSQRNFGDSVWRFGIRNPNHRVLKVHLVLLHDCEFLVDSESCFSDDPDHVAQMSKSVRLDALLFRPRHVVGPEQAFHLHGEFHASTRIEGEHLLTDSDIEHSAENSKFLVNRRRLLPVAFNASGNGFPLYPLFQPTTKICFDIVG